MHIIARNTAKKGGTLYFYTAQVETLQNAEIAALARVSAGLHSGACFSVALMSGVVVGCSVEPGRSVVAAPVGCLIERARDKVLGLGRSKGKLGPLEERLGRRLLARGRPSTSRSDELCPRTLVTCAAEETHMNVRTSADSSFNVTRYIVQSYNRTSRCCSKRHWKRIQSSWE